MQMVWTQNCVIKKAFGRSWSEIVEPGIFQRSLSFYNLKSTYNMDFRFIETPLEFKRYEKKIL